MMQQTHEFTVKSNRLKLLKNSVFTDKSVDRTTKAAFAKAILKFGHLSPEELDTKANVLRKKLDKLNKRTREDLRQESISWFKKLFQILYKK